MLQPKQPKSPLTSIFAAWILAGTLDISTAFVMVAISGKNPLLVGNYIASAVFGRADAYAGGMPMIIAGLLFHYLIAFIFTVIFFLLYPKIYPVIKNKFVAGILYGLFVWCIMNLLVVPLTRIPARPFSIVNAVENIAILMLAIGLPVSLIAYHYYFGKEK
ncbi:MAG: hypothetical protein ABJB86_13885 [Bacteroidota bacterium]